MDNNDIMMMETQRIKHDFLKNLENYKKYIHEASLDIPVETLCLPKSINKILIRNGLNRVKEIAAADLTKVKGLGEKSIEIIRFRIDEFRSL